VKKHDETGEILEITMFNRSSRFYRWLTLAASGCILLQAPGCDTTLQFIQTGLLAAITGLTFFLARNV